jgi:hypothetical protein
MELLFHRSVKILEIKYYSNLHKAPASIDDVTIFIKSDKMPTDAQWLNGIIDYIQRNFPCSVRSVQYKFISDVGYYAKLDGPTISIPDWCKVGNVVTLRYSVADPKCRIISVEPNGEVTIEHVEKPGLVKTVFFNYLCEL